MSKAPYFIWRFIKLDKAALKEYLSEEKEAVTKKIKDAESEIQKIEKYWTEFELG